MTKYCTQYDIAIIGAGPAGLMAAIEASGKNKKILLLEKGASPGRKLLATGGGRCNLTHNGDVAAFLAGFDKKDGRFLKHAAWAFTPDDTIRYFEDRDIPLAVERGDRVFPKRGGARQILNALTREATTSGVTIRTSAPVQTVEQSKNESGIFFRITAAGETYTAASVLITTGGSSMRRTGSTGDGYRLAEKLGHTIIPPRPSLVQLVTAESWPAKLNGISLKNVRLTARINGKLHHRFGDLMFTLDGIGGPIVLEMSRILTDPLNEIDRPVECTIDLKPALDDKKLDARLLRELDKSPRRLLKNVLLSLMPGRLADTFIGSFGFDGNREASVVTREERKRLRLLLKAMPVTVTATGPLEDALVTRGGVDIGEIDPRTMGSKIMPGLFFAGEVMDVDGDCGGYNLQMCWATGILAGQSAAAYCGGEE